MYWPYVVPLLIVCSAAMLCGGVMLRVSLAIFLNWVFGTAFVMLTDIYDPWRLSLILDTISATIIMYQPAGRMQAVIGCTYMGQIILHVIYAFSNQQVGAHPYWQMLTAMAFVQLLLLGGWTIDRGRRFIWRRRHPHLAGTASTTGMGR